MGLMIVVVFIISAIVGYISDVQGASSALFYPLMGLLLVIVGWSSVAYWSRLDEAAREAHKFAWYWGGSTGLAVPGAAVLIMGSKGVSTFLWPGMEATPAGYLATGALIIICAQLLGYALVWVGWWLWNSRS